jgi:ergothioneine biosynthesis protein EgtB
MSGTENAARRPDVSSHTDIIRRLFETRRLSLDLAAPLSPEDMTVQAMPDASPTKWHLAHTTWFFETFVLIPHLPGYRLYNEAFSFCFNSYYEAVGARQPRAYRGLLTRPTSEQVFAYRAHVDEALDRLLSGRSVDTVAGLIEIGINHEQQHQELLLTDILALFAANPLRPAYFSIARAMNTVAASDLQWIDYVGGIREVGATGELFAWDNEGPRHAALIRPFRLADRLVTNGEWLQFMQDGGYGAASLWLADGWTLVKSEGWRAPLYWEGSGSAWHEMSLNGLMPLDLAAPVSHVSYYEADAYARWSSKRLPTEFEWEIAAAGQPVSGNDLSTRLLRPVAAARTAGAGPRQLFGDVWEWTQSAYLPYPGYAPAEGALGEYNGKFMVGQHVLRGASCVTPSEHSRATYRNFFYPQQRWQFTGVRLASEID